MLFLGTILFLLLKKSLNAIYISIYYGTAYKCVDVVLGYIVNI